MAETPKAENLTWHRGEIGAGDRRKAYGHRGAVLWLTGLSGSGKSTLAHRLERKLLERGCVTYVLDGDNVRHGLNADLGFAPDERKENIRRVGHVARLFADSGALVITAFISPYRADRDQIRAMLPEGDFVEIHVAADLATCEERDPKGLYAKARAGEIKGFTGIDAPYEAPETPELKVDTGSQDVDGSAGDVLAWLEERGYFDAED
ncbi:MAG: adenylyl-sulfate kinase [Deltaproteobacteria bacterium]|nr:adenylyl-sulfate kinase [Deltaproteobacteria bacterium]